MKKKLLISLIGTLTALSFGTAIAQPGPGPGYGQGPHGDAPRMEQRRTAYRIQHRIDAQEREIRQGIRERKIDRREARILRDNINDIKRSYNRAKRTDRYVSMDERARLDQMLDRNERMIRRMENNGIVRFGR